jgi:hypothetical protein
MTRQEIINLIISEIERAETKHPDWPMDKVYAATIVAEESGELTRACLQYEAENGSLNEIKKEAIQTACTCIRLIENLPILELDKALEDVDNKE